MAEVEASKLPTLAEHYLVEEKEKKTEVFEKAIEEVKDTSPDEVVEKIEETPTAVVSEDAPPPPPAAVEEKEESKESSPDADDTSDENGNQESNDVVESENSDNQEVAEEETPEIKLETAPADFRFPTTNQSRHCFTRYIEYHRCVGAKGDEAPECDKFAKYYRSLCPGEWVDRWNEQRENGTFPGPL